MAKGDITIFQKFRERLGDGQINLSSAVIKCALTNHTVASPPGTLPWRRGATSGRRPRS